MKLSRLTILIAALAMAASALAQFTAGEKAEVLDAMDHVLQQEAFVPGVDLGKFRSYVDSRKEKLDSAESPFAFASVVNDALKQFGLSHIQLMPGRMRRGWGGEAVAQQGFGMRSRSAQLSWVDDNTAMIRVPSFEYGYDDDLMAELFSRAHSAKSLIVDLRGNPGGEVDNMRGFLGYLVPKETPIGTFVSRRMAESFAASEKSSKPDPVAIATWAHREIHPIAGEMEPFAGKVAVLIDKGSASASEIVACTLREALHAPLIGSPSRGAVLVSTFDRLPYGFRLQFPIGDYVSHGARRLEGHPLMPDVSAEGDDAIKLAADSLLRH